MSSLADRINIYRRYYHGLNQSNYGDDVNLSVQFLLNCGGDMAGSCHGGSSIMAYKFIHEFGYVVRHFLAPSFPTFALMGSCLYFLSFE